MRQPDHPAAEDQPMLAFVHIPRTGGGTFSSAISKNYSRLQGPGNFQKNPEATRNAVARIGRERIKKAVGDHVPYGLYRRHLPADTRYLTLLRDPVDRVLSHYHFHAQAGRTPERGAQKLRTMWAALLNLERLDREGGEHEEAIVLEPDAEVSLEEGLRRRIPIYDNFMTRFLGGGESLFGELPPDAVERAKENISQFWFVGIRERLDDSIILLGRKLGVGLMPYHHRHASQKRPPLDETPAELRELVATHNAMDIELYRFAREQFEATAPAPDELAKDVEELRQLSVAVTAKGEAHKATKGERKAALTAAHAEREARRAANRAERAGARGTAAGAAAPEGKKEKKARTGKKARESGKKPRTGRKTPVEAEAEASDQV
jgi:sulfotransferase family protein